MTNIGSSGTGASNMREHSNVADGVWSNPSTFYGWLVGLARTVYIYTVYTPYMAINLVISLPKTPYIHRICMILANPIGWACQVN